jgi:HlyD family secretion protein
MIALLMLSGLAGFAAFFPFDKTPAWHFKTVPVQRGDLTVTVAATGTLQPVNQVEVGTEISGTVKTVAVDYNDPHSIELRGGLYPCSSKTA